MHTRYTHILSTTATLCVLATFLLHSTAEAQGSYRLRTAFTNPGTITVLVTGALNNTPDPAGEFSVLVENIYTGQPVAGVDVTLTITGGFGAFFPGKLFWPDGIWTRHECQTSTTVSAQTFIDGIARFRPCGSASHAGACVNGSIGGLLSAPGVASPIQCQIACFDHDANGLSINDLSLFLADLGCASYVGHADYDGNQSVTVNDLSILLANIGTGNSSQRPTVSANCLTFP